MIPLVLFTYNRPSHLYRVLDSLKKNKIRLLYIFHDGPKSEKDFENTSIVEDIIRRIDWCDTKLHISDKNKGLGNSIRDGISTVFKDYYKLIVIEDDIILRPGAFELAEKALNHYEKNNQVMSISMWNHPILMKKKYPNGFFSKRFVCWGWGTYKWGWELYNAKPLNLYNECVRRGIDLGKWGEDIKWQAENAEKKNLWYIGYMLTHFLHNKYSFFFPESLTINIGRDGSGSNTSGGHRDYQYPLDEGVSPVFFPEFVFNEEISRYFCKYFSNKESYYSKMKNLFAKFNRKTIK